MGGISIDWNAFRDEMMQHACDFWHEMTGGELYWYVESPFVPDMFERMEIANLSGVMFRG